jgi:hypothetical protein
MRTVNTSAMAAHQAAAYATASTACATKNTGGRAAGQRRRSVTASAPTPSSAAVPTLVSMSATAPTTVPCPPETKMRKYSTAYGSQAAAYTCQKRGERRMRERSAEGRDTDGARKQRTEAGPKYARAEQRKAEVRTAIGTLRWTRLARPERSLCCRWQSRSACIMALW